MFFTLQDLIKRELDYLKFVYPNKSINNEEFIRAHDVISEQVRKERKSLRKDSGKHNCYCSLCLRSSLVSHFDLLALASFLKNLLVGSRID